MVALGKFWQLGFSEKSIAVRVDGEGEEAEEDYFGCVCELRNFDLSVEQFTNDFRSSIHEIAQELLEDFVAVSGQEPLVEEISPAEEIDIEECKKCGYKANANRGPIVAV